MKSKSVLVCVLLAVVTSLSLPGVSQEPVPPLRGEEYFLVRVLETLYERWPLQTATSEEFAADAEELRREAIRLRVRAESAGAHPAIARAYADFVTQMDRQTTFLVNLGAIRQAAADHAGTESFASGFKGGYSGAEAFTVLDQEEDISTKEAAIAAIVIGAVTYAADAWVKAGQRNAAERAAVSAEVRALQDDMAATLERTRQGFQQLADLRGWKPMEIGWDLSPEPAEKWLRLREAGDVAGMVEEAARQRRERPSDPFIRLNHGYFQALQEEGNAALLVRLAEDARAALDFIPKDPVYLNYRLAGMTQACLLVNAALLAGRRTGVPPEGSKPISGKAVSWWEEICWMQPSDPTGKLRYGRAMAYALHGELGKALDGLAEVADLKKHDGGFLYTCAWIFGLQGDLQESLEFLEAAMRTGAVGPAYVRADPMLLVLRDGRSEAFDRLTRPQWSFRVKSGIWFDDISVTNQSPFHLTDVKLTSKLPGWNPALEAAAIAPGETKTWSWVAKPPPGREVSFILSCGQDP